MLIKLLCTPNISSAFFLTAIIRCNEVHNIAKYLVGINGGAKEYTSYRDDHLPKCAHPNLIQSHHLSLHYLCQNWLLDSLLPSA